MMLDKNGKLFGKISIIDLLAIFAVIIAVLGISARFVTTAAKNVREKTQFSYVVEIEGIRFYTIDALNKKGIVTDLKGNSVVGEITNVEYKRMEIQSVTSTGETVFATVPEKYTALITVKAEGNESEKGYFVGDNIELSVGSTMSMTTKYVNSTGKVKSIEKID
ncbi:MAG: DUF4330 domain-containing protein [Clostridia bacterium]|nr:DUF4330 domain-containing protein [Clostridia bacterium]